MKKNSISKDIAVVGISCRFPKSRNSSEYWDNLAKGIELTHFFTKEELEDIEVSKDQLNDPDYIGVESKISNSEYFDFSFFGYTPEEAAVMDPQIRIFHEHVWKAIEDAGYNLNTYQKKIGLFATANDNLNWRIHALTSNDNVVNPFFRNQISDKNYISTLISYKLNLRGPTYYIDTACSSSLAAIHLACRNLLLRECTMAVAGGVRINTEKGLGYVYQEGMIFSKDGHCRAFDKDASGTISGEGVGVVVLKRYDEAIKDNDHIYAVIKSSAVNNDGSNKIGYTAPSVDGQSDCIRLAHRIAGVSASSISYIETHGTGTRLGDPIEIEALNKAFDYDSTKYCAIGSVKTNMGHLSAAAGVAGFIKTVLALKNKKLPPSLNYINPNPEINFDRGPFYVNTQLKEWERLKESPLRAGVSSFGIGGTNAHIVLEEAPVGNNTTDYRPYQLIRISAKSKVSVDRYREELKQYLEKKPKINIADIAYTLHVGRAHFNIRNFAVARNTESLQDKLNFFDGEEFYQNYSEDLKKLVFMFPGGGTQFINMGYEIYTSEPYFREQMDKGFEILNRISSKDFKRIIFNDKIDDNVTPAINEIEHIQPLLFLFEYALAKLLIHWGIKPDYMIGHSLGEYVAACISGVFSFESAMRIIYRRGQLMSTTETGYMLSIGHPIENINDSLLVDISIAAINSSDSFVVAGRIKEIIELEKVLTANEISYRRLKISIASHSELMMPIMDALREELNTVELAPPKLPFISNSDGKLITNEQATSVEYWVNHLKNTVMFSDGIETLLNKKNTIFVEVGPGKTLTTFLKQITLKKEEVVPTINLIRHPFEQIDDNELLMRAIGCLWIHGIDVNQETYYQYTNNHRISIPTYVFEENKFSVKEDPYTTLQQKMGGFIEKKDSLEWMYTQKWKQILPVELSPNEKVNWTLIFYNENEFSERIKTKYIETRTNVFFVRQGDCFALESGNGFSINPSSDYDYNKLFETLSSIITGNGRIIHLWNSAAIDTSLFSEISLRESQFKGYYSLLNIVRAFDEKIKESSLVFKVVLSDVFQVFKNDKVSCEKSTILGALKVIPKEYNTIKLSCIEFSSDEYSTHSEEINAQVLKSITKLETEEIIAIRLGERWTHSYEAIKHVEKKPKNLKIRIGGTYLITGGNGGMAKVFSKHLIEQYQANLILIGRTPPTKSFLDSLSNGSSKTLFIQSDINDIDLLRAELKTFLQENNLSLDGVIHAAGIADFAGLIKDRRNEDCETIFSAKVYGTQNLYNLTSTFQPDFFINCSSNSSLMAPFGQVGYVAANCFQNYFAYANNSKCKIISILWDSWKETGMAVEARKRNSINKQLKIHLDQRGITNLEGITFLESALYYSQPNFIIASNDLSTWIESSKKMTIERVIKQVEEKNNETKFSIDRPVLKTQYTAPTSDTEKVLCEMWEDFFGIKKIGIHDNFFEIGGDSLKAMTIMNSIKKTFRVSISLKDLFTKPTIHFLALNIDLVKGVQKGETDATTFNKIKI